jgi:hypothetical protein
MGRPRLFPVNRRHTIEHVCEGFQELSIASVLGYSAAVGARQIVESLS